MAGSSKPRPLWKTLLIALSWVLLMLFLTSSDFLDETIDREQKYIEIQLGEDSMRYVFGTGAQWYQELIVDTGAYHAMHRMLIPNDQEKYNSKGMQKFGNWWFDWIEQRLNAAMRILYLYLCRVLQLSLWLPFVPILIIPMLWDGLMTYMIKRTDFEYASPTRQKYSVGAVSFMLFMTLLLFGTPIAISPLFYPALIFLAGIFLQITVANMQKRI